MPTTHCLPLRFLPPRVTDLADVGLHIFNHFFSPRKSDSRLVSLPLSLSSFRTNMPIEPFHCVSLSFLLSFSALPRNACAFHPEKWIFSFGKKSEKSADSLHEARGGSRLVRARKRSDAERTNERTSARTERMVEQKGVEGGEAGGREKRERESRVKQRRSRRENENHASAYEERG